MRQAYEKPPVLAADNTPRVKSATGLGNGGGAGLLSASPGEYTIGIIIGYGMTPSGSIVLQWPFAPPALFVSSATLSGLSLATVGNQTTIAWSGKPAFGHHTIEVEYQVMK